VDNQSFFKSLIATLPKWIHQFQKSKHENILYTNPDYLFQLLWFLKYHTNTRFQVLIDICGVDHPSRKRRFEVVYNLLRATAKSPNKVLICAKQMRRCRSLQRDGHDLSNRYTARDTQRDELPMENIACRERESQGIANPWAIPNRVFETQLNREKNLFIYLFIFFLFVNVRCRWDISPSAFGKTPMEYHSVFFVRRSLVTIVPRQQRNQDP
jgi:hypothetical protein